MGSGYVPGTPAPGTGPYFPDAAGIYRIFPDVKRGEIIKKAGKGGSALDAALIRYEMGLMDRVSLMNAVPNNLKAEVNAYLDARDKAIKEGAHRAGFSTDMSREDKKRIDDAEKAKRTEAAYRSGITDGTDLSPEAKTRIDAEKLLTQLRAELNMNQSPNFAQLEQKAQILPPDLQEQFKQDIAEKKRITEIRL